MCSCAETPPTWSWQSHVRQCLAGILLGHCLKVTHWSAATCTPALLTQRSRLHKFGSSVAYLMGDDMQIYRRRKERMSFARQALLSFSHYYDFSWTTSLSGLEKQTCISCGRFYLTVHFPPGLLNVKAGKKPLLQRQGRNLYSRETELNPWKIPILPPMLMLV